MEYHPRLQIEMSIGKHWCDFSICQLCIAVSCRSFKAVIILKIRQNLCRIVYTFAPIIISHLGRVFFFVLSKKNRNNVSIHERLDSNRNRCNRLLSIWETINIWGRINAPCPVYLSVIMKCHVECFNAVLMSIMSILSTNDHNPGPSNMQHIMLVVVITRGTSFRHLVLSCCFKRCASIRMNTIRFRCSKFNQF